jgi:hypothetical protein
VVVVVAAVEAVVCVEVVASTAVEAMVAGDCVVATVVDDATPVVDAGDVHDANRTVMAAKSPRFTLETLSAIAVVAAAPTLPRRGPRLDRR